jgi:hypothetical protein
MFPHRFDRYRMMGFIMHELRQSQDLTQQSLGERIEAIRSSTSASKKPSTTLQRRISQIENFDQLKERADLGQSPVAREVFISTAGEGLGLSQVETDALLWLIEADDFQPLTETELNAHTCFGTTQPREYTSTESRFHCLSLLERAVRSNKNPRNPSVQMVTGWEEEHQVLFRRQLLRIEKEPGQRLLISKYPSFLTYPGDLFEHMESFEELSSDTQNRIRKLTTGRQQNFREKLKEYGERTILSMESLTRYLKRDFHHQLPWHQRRKHVGHFIDLLEDSPLYQVALAPAEPEMTFLIKSGSGASLRGPARDLNYTRHTVICGPLYMFWNDRTAVYSFMLDFEYAWDQVPENLRTKKQVILELKRLLRNANKIASMRVNA